MPRFLLVLCILAFALPARALDRVEIAGPIEPQATTRAEVRDRVFLIAQTAQSSRAGKALAQGRGADRGRVRPSWPTCCGNGRMRRTGWTS